jgi:type I restriction enzyme S subunit
MRQGWQIKKLSEVATISSGNAAPQRKELFEKGIYPFIRTSDVGQIRKGYINSCVDYLNKEGIKGLKLFKKGTILFPKSGASTFLNHRVMMVIDSFVSSHLATIKANSSVAEDGFLFYYLTTIDARDLMQDIAYPSLKTSDIGLIGIPIPPLPEQQRIVAILDEAFASIAKAKSNAEQNLKNAKELFESYVETVFENKSDVWKRKSLGEVCEISSKLIDPKSSMYQNLLHIGGGNIESKTGTLIDLKTAKEENLISGKFLFDNRMVLYSKIRPYLMKVVKCEFEGLCSADIYPLLGFNNLMIRDFLYYLLLTKKFTDYAIQGSQRAGMPKVNRDHLFEYQFNLPPITTQQTIVNKLDALSLENKKLQAIFQQKLHDLEELKKSVLQKAFKGEL